MAPPIQRAIQALGNLAGLIQVVQSDPPEYRQAEGDPECEPAIIGDVEDRQGPEEVVYGWKTEGA